ncbi:MAG: phage holin family protein [Peptococcaceae bacterium]|nr:phage holin family protein [Peptococcaceae bacterium]
MAVKKQVIKILANIVAIYIGTYIFPDVVINSVTTAITAALALWLVNLIIRPLLLFITLPINILTLGLFSLVINTWMVMLVAKLVNGFWLSGFWTAFGVAILVSITFVILEKILK